MKLVGTTVGKIRIVEQLGKGGMGEVYLGFDETLKRKVAVKAIHGGQRLQEKSKARFLREAEILSRLEHPHICRVYDFIETEQHDFLVMELIRGSDLTELQDKLSHSEKLVIAEQIAEAFSVAHEQNIVHRDLKPDNVMLALSGNVKVLDFGLAVNFADQEGSDQDPESGECEVTEEVRVDLGGGETKVVRAPIRLATGGFRTEQGVIRGTPMYMSPEQARGERTTGASDMYSFGLLLQWLFTGKEPYPPKITVTGLLIKAMSGDTRPIEGLDFDLTQLINRLKSIIPENRPTALDALERIRWIREKPRRKARKLAGLAFAALLVIGTALSTLGFYRATKEADNARQTVSLLQEFLSSVDPKEKGKDLKVLELLEVFKPRLDELEDKPLIQASLYYTYAKTYQGLGLYDRSYACAQKSLDIRIPVLGEEHPDTLSSMNNLASVLYSLGKHTSAERYLRQCVERRKRVLGDEHPDTLRSLNNLAVVVFAQGKYAEAERFYRECSETQKRVLGEAHPDTLSSLNNLALVLFYQGKHDQAEPIYRECLKAQKRVQGEEHPVTLSSMNNLALTLGLQGRHDEAEPLIRQVVEIADRVLGKDHPITNTYVCSHGEILEGLGDLEAAIRLYQKAARKDQIDAQEALKRLGEEW